MDTPFPAKKRRPGGKGRSKRLKKKRLKYGQAMADILSSIMRHPSDEWSREERLRLRPFCKDVFGVKMSLGLSRRHIRRTQEGGRGASS